MSASPNPIEQASKSPESLTTGQWLRFGDGAVKASALALALALGFGLGVNGFSVHAPEPQLDSPAVETQAALKKLSDENDALRVSVASLRAQVQALQAEAAAANRARANDQAAATAPNNDAAKKTGAPVHSEAVNAATPAPAAPAPGEAAHAPALPYYAYVYRYEKNGSSQYGTGAGHYENVTAARAEALAGCQSHGGVGCKFNFASAGNCIAVARAQKGPLRVSTMQPDDKSAATDALAQCAQDQPTAPCQVVKTLCPKPE